MSAIREGCASDSVDISFRLMTEQDIDAVMAIEEDIHSFPWTHGIFSDCIKIGYLCLVMESKGKLVSYAVISTAVEESHLLTLVVAADEQGKGYGKRMLNKMIQMAVSDNAKTMYLEVRSSNKIAIQLYHQRGFNELGIRKNYYPSEKGREDALILALDLSFELSR